MRIAASLNLSNVESSKAPHLVPEVCEILAMVPSKRSLRTKKVTKRVPTKNFSLLKKYDEDAITPKEPMIVIPFADTPIFSNPRHSGVMSLVTGARRNL
jgi:hypothetical protein